MRETDPVAASVHARITRVLLKTGRHAEGWMGPDPYSRRILPRHAALAGRVDELISEPGYLEAADPDALLAVLPLGGPDVVGGAIRSYRRAVHVLGSLRPTERAVALDVAESAGGEA